MHWQNGLFRCVAAMALALFFAPMAQAEAVIIRNDGGGNITDYRARRLQLAKAEIVIIAEKCLSACAIFTTLPNACVMPDARIGFHGTQPKSGVPSIDLWLDMRMGEFFRGEVRRKFETEWRHLGGRDQFHMVRGTELKQLDPQIRLCKKRRR